MAVLEGVDTGCLQLKKLNCYAPWTSSESTLHPKQYKNKEKEERRKDEEVDGEDDV